MKPKTRRKATQSALDLGPVIAPMGVKGFGGFVFAIKLPELLKTHLVSVRAKLGKYLLALIGPKF